MINLYGKGMLENMRTYASTSAKTKVTMFIVRDLLCIISFVNPCARIDRIEKEHAQIPVARAKGF